MKKVFLLLISTVIGILSLGFYKNPEDNISKIELYGSYSIIGLKYIEYIAELHANEYEAISSIISSQMPTHNFKIAKYAFPFAYLKVFFADGTWKYYGIDYDNEKGIFYLYYGYNNCIPISIPIRQIPINNPADNKIIKEILYRHSGTPDSFYQDTIDRIIKRHAQEINLVNGITPLFWLSSPKELHPGFIFSSDLNPQLKQFFFIWEDDNSYNFSYHYNNNWKIVWYTVSINRDFNYYSLKSNTNFVEINHSKQDGRFLSYIKEQYFKPHQEFRDHYIKQEKLNSLSYTKQQSSQYIFPEFREEINNEQLITDMNTFKIYQYNTNSYLLKSHNAMVYRVEFIPEKNICILSIKHDDQIIMLMSFEDNKLIQLIDNNTKIIQTDIENSKCNISYISYNDNNTTIQKTIIDNTL